MKKRITRDEIAYIFEAALEHFIALFVTGTMLGYILDTLGFSDALQGIVSTVATFTCGAQLFALFLVGRRKKRVVVIGNLINQLFFVLIYLFPVFPLSPSFRTALLMVLLLVGHVISNAMTPSRITWLMSAVPSEERGRFTAVKEMFSLAGGIVVSLSFGRVADIFRDANGMPTRPYYLICAAALMIMMLLHTVCLLLSSEREACDTRHLPARAVLCRMLSNRSLLLVIGVGVLWNITSALSTSFFVSYVREELSFSFTVIATISMTGSIARILASPLLGRLADKRSFATSMTVAFIAAALAFLAMAFATPATRWLYLVYVCLHSFAMAGVISGSINLIYDYIAPTERAVALGVKNAIGGVLAFVTALLAGMLLDKLQAVGGLTVMGVTLYAQQVLAVLSFLATLFLIVYMRLVIAPLRRIDR